MKVTLPLTTMAGGALHKSNGKPFQKSDGLPSPERSGSPELKPRSSQWKLDRLAYASKEDAHQIDDWPETTHNRKSEDVLVRYKDTRGSKGLSSRMDPHAWSDLPTDTDDEFAETATSPAWNDALSSNSERSSKTGISIPKMQKPKLAAATLRSIGARMTSSAQRQGMDTKSGDCVATLHDGASQGEKGRFSYRKSPPLAPIQMAGEEVTMRMSHRYYTSGGDPHRRRMNQTRDNMEDKHRTRKRREKVESRAHSSSTSLDSDCSDHRKPGCQDVEDTEESFQQMVLQKYLVMGTGKPKKTQNYRSSNDTEGRRSKSPGATKLLVTGCDHRFFTGKNLHPIISPSRRRQCHKKKPENPPRQSAVSQPTPVLEKEQKEQNLSSLVVVLRKSCSSGDLQRHLNGHLLTHREVLDVEKSMTEQEKKLRSESVKVEDSQGDTCPSPGEICPSRGDICPSEGHGMDLETKLTDVVAEVKKEEESEGCPTSKVSEAQLGEHDAAMGEHSLSALALFSGTEKSSEKCLVNEAPVESAQVDGNGGSRIEEPQQVNHAQESSNGNGQEREPKRGNAAPKFRIGKVTAGVPLDSSEGDHVLPDVSLAAQPPSHTLPELHHEAEVKQQVRRQRQRYGSSEMIVQQRRGFWDSSQELQKEKQVLLKRLQELEVPHPCNRLKAMSGTKVQLTEEDAKRLRQEILEQEALIRGYQVENEKAVVKLKEVQLEAKQKLQEMAEEKAHLASQLANRHMQSYGADSASLHEKLQGALSRETIARMELDKMRDAYFELEKRVKREESSRMKDLEQKLTMLHETLEAERQSHAQMEGRKQAMIQQEELIASLQETVSDQVSQIRALTTRLEEGQAGKSFLLENHEAQQQIETLQTQVKRLEQSLRAAKKQTDLHALQVAKSGMDQENETVRRMQAEFQRREEEANRVMHHLRVENEKIKHESVTRIRNLKQQIQTRAQSAHSVSESELAALNRVKDLEKQVKELSEKLEEASKPKLEEVLNSARAGMSMGPPAPRAAQTRLIQPAQGKALREAKERIALQEDVISQKDRTIKSLQTQLQEMAGPVCTKSEPIPSETQSKLGAAAQEVMRCTSRTSEQESLNLSNKGGTSSDSNATTEEVAVLRRELEKSELTREVLQKACNESVEKAVMLTLQHQQTLQLQQIRQSQMSHHRSSGCQTPSAGWSDHRSALESMNWLSDRSSSEIANRHAMEARSCRMKVMSEELEGQQSPRMRQIMSLKKKVAEMEARQQQRETEWQKLLKETKQTSSIEQEYAERKWREALNSKSVEVEKIRLELNAIIEAAMAMQQAQPR